MKFHETQVIAHLLAGTLVVDDVKRLVGPQDFTDVTLAGFLSEVYDAVDGGVFVDRFVLESMCEVDVGEPKGDNPHLYVEAIKKESKLRNLKKSASMFADAAKSPSDIESFLSEVLSLARESDGGGMYSAKNAFGKLENDLRVARENGYEDTSMRSSFVEIESMTGGLRRGEMTIIAGRPSMGKTAYALSIMLSLAKKGYRVLFFSIEMPSEMIIRRLSSMISGIPLSAFRDNRLTSEDYAKLDYIRKEIGDLDFFIDDKTIGIGGVLSSIRRNADNVDVVFLDYLQLLGGDNKKLNREREVAHMSSSLKLIAKELGKPIVVLSQLNRGVERGDSKSDKKPALSDLRDSGAIEQDADVVQMLYRESYYNRIEGAADPTKATVIVAKNRNGAVGEVNVRFDPTTTEFRSWDIYEEISNGRREVI